MPKVTRAKRSKGTADEQKERKIRQMSRALGVDIAQVAKMLDDKDKAEEQEDLSTTDIQDSVDHLREDSSVKADSVTDLITDSHAMQSTPGTVLFCGGTDWDEIGKKKGSTKGNLAMPHRISFKTRIAAVYSGPAACHSIAVDICGVAYSWGRNDLGQCGIGSKKVQNRPAPIKLPQHTKIVSVGCGRAHTVMVASDGALYSFGCGTSGQLGNGRILTDKTPQVTPGRVNLPSGARAELVSCGGDFSIVIATNGRLYSFGHPEYGQLGNGTNGEVLIAGKAKLGYNLVPSPYEIQEFISRDSQNRSKETFSGIKFSEVSCGRNHTIALEKLPGRRVFSWGFGGYGRLGHARSDDEFTPCSISVFDRLAHVSIKKLIAGGTCSIALTDRGFLYFWGTYPNAPRGEATMYPKMIDDLGNLTVRCVAASSQCIMIGGEACTASWGSSIAGELGYGEGEPKSSSKPKLVDSMEGLKVLSIAMGKAHSILISEDKSPEDKELLENIPEYRFT